MGNEIITRDVDAITWQTMKEQATMLVKSGFLPKAVDTAEKAMAIAMKGRELGLPMMQSITSINVIDGKPTISAELMAALVHQRIPGAVLRCVETTNERATYEAGRPGDKILRMSFTWQDAVQAGVTNKNNWKNYPAAMLRARCCSAICRVVFPDAIMGCYTPDELGAITTEDSGEIVDITPSAGKPPVSQPQAKSAAKAPEKSTVRSATGENGTYEDLQLITGVLEKVSTKSGEGKKGPWVVFYVKLSGDDMLYSTFDTNIGAQAQALEGGRVSLTYKQDGKYNVITGIESDEAPVESF